jgi:hypothetical protein
MKLSSFDSDLFMIIRKLDGISITVLELELVSEERSPIMVRLEVSFGDFEEQKVVHSCTPLSKEFCDDSWMLVIQRRNIEGWVRVSGMVLKIILIPEALREDLHARWRIVSRVVVDGDMLIVDEMMWIGKKWVIFSMVSSEFVVGVIPTEHRSTKSCAQRR